ncbi:MAG: M28 family peptidase [Prolixibacteraceae bacterium]|nr:M28 family peptidase [Prolixibacteraceae bacterium]
MKKSLILIFYLFLAIAAPSQEPVRQIVDLEAFHLISSHDLLDYAGELCSEKYGGRLSGSPGYEAAATWVASKLEEWNIKPAVAGSYFQYFHNAYTEVLTQGKIELVTSPLRNVIDLFFPDDYYPGSNSGSGDVEGEAVYVGFGISAPELGYDDYANLDVKGKIVLMESGVPHLGNDTMLARWEPYSYHRYKFERARELGAAGLLYVGLLANPNTSYFADFVYAHISESIAEKLFAGTGRLYANQKLQITNAVRPQSIPLKHSVSISASTQHFPDTQSCNVIGIIEGSDPALKNEAIILGAHLDAVGSPGMLFPGALDNASGVADLLGAAHALSHSAVKPGRSIIFIFFGGEECGLYGSTHFVQNPVWEKEKTAFMMNLDMVGNGAGFTIGGGSSHPNILRHFNTANDRYIHRSLGASQLRQNYGRPRTDAAVFEKAGYCTLGLWTTGQVKKIYYHQPLDNLDGLTPELMEDAAKLLYISILGASLDENLIPQNRVD